MAPKKQQSQRKRTRMEQGSSSSSVPRGLNDNQAKLYRQLEEKKQIVPNVYVNWTLIREYGQERSFERLMADPAWATLLSLKEKIYRGVTLEFLATFKIHKPNRLFGLDNEVTFRAFGKSHTLTMAQFCEYTGLYSPDFIDSDEFRALPTLFPRELSINSVWSRFARTFTYDSSLSRGSHLKKASYRILHSLLAHSLYGRLNATGVVSQLELYAMWSMITGTRVNVGIELAFAIRQQAQLSKKGAFCGAYITRILKNMNEFPQSTPTDEVGESFPMSENVLVQFGIPKAPGGEPSSEEEEEDTIQETTPQRLDALTNEVRKLRKKNKSLKKYIQSIAEAFATKLKVKLPDCISSSSSSSDDGNGDQQAEGGKTQGGSQEDETEREIDAYQDGEEEMEGEA